MLTNTTGRELKKAFAESGGNAKYAIVLVSHMSHIPRSDQAKLRTLAAETSKQQLKYLKRAWEEGIEACDRPGAIYEKLMSINNYRSQGKLMDNIVDCKKLKYMVITLINGATVVMVERVRNILNHLRVDQLEIDSHLQTIENDFGSVAQQIGKDLVIAQNETAIIDTVQRCLKTYIRSESIENASLLDIYMRGHAARVQAAEMGLGGVDGGNVGNVDLKQYAHDRGVCYAYQTASCESGPVGSTCRHKHVCLWCGKKHGMRKCFDLVPKELRKQFKPRWNGSNEVDNKRKEKK